MRRICGHLDRGPLEDFQAPLWPLVDFLCSFWEMSKMLAESGGIFASHGECLTDIVHGEGTQARLGVGTGLESRQGEQDWVLKPSLGCIIKSGAAWAMR